MNLLFFHDMQGILSPSAGEVIRFSFLIFSQSAFSQCRQFSYNV